MKPTKLILALTILISTFSNLAFTAEVAPQEVLSITSENKPQQTIIYSFLGAPGSGKSSVCSLCSKILGFSKIICSDEIRKKMNESNNDKLSIEIKNLMENGEMIPDKIVIKIINEKLLELSKYQKPIILDGYPRNQYQAQELMNLLSKSIPGAKLKLVIFDISDTELENRLLNRVTCKTCKISFMKNKLTPSESGEYNCTKCSNTLEKRKDDSIQIFRKRLVAYKKQLNSLMNFYQYKKILIQQFESTGETADEIFTNFKKTVSQLSI